MSEFLQLPFKKWTTLNGFSASGNYMILPTTLRDSIHLSNSSQFRFQCKLPQEQKSLHFMTTGTGKGRAVVDWLTARTNERPTACGSYQVLADDSSYFAKHCAKWANNDKWGSWETQSVPVNDRFVNHLMFIPGTAHWNLFLNPNRFECDNSRYSKSINTGDEWNIFVR